MTPIQRRFVSINGRQVHYRIAGRGPVLLLIHGIGDNSSTWEPIMTRLASKYTVIAPDMLGHGFSDKPRADYSVAAFANGVRDLLWVLGHERVTVVGHSLGGGVAALATLLLQEHRNTGDIGLRKFYARRAVRLLPSVWLFCAVWIVIGVIGKIATAVEWVIDNFSHMVNEVNHNSIFDNKCVLSWDA